MRGGGTATAAKLLLFLRYYDFFFSFFYKGGEGRRDAELRNNRCTEEPFSELSFPALKPEVSPLRQQKRDRSRVPPGAERSPLFNGEKYIFSGD